jgi:hypothetical protein
MLDRSPAALSNGYGIRIAEISKYFRDHDPQQISDDKSDRLETLFDIF